MVQQQANWLTAALSHFVGTQAKLLIS